MDHPKRVNVISLEEYLGTVDCEDELDPEDIEGWI